VSVAAPPLLMSGDGSMILTADDGSTTPGQLVSGADGERLWFVVDALPAGGKRTYSVAFGGSSEPRFEWTDVKDKQMDLSIGGRQTLRYDYTPFDAKDVENTKKPFHQVFDPNGSRLITKGVGGKFPHHRGIYFGYSKCGVDGQTYDTWHCFKGEHQLHRGVAAAVAGAVVGGHTVKIDWNDRQGKPFIEESRTLRVYHQPTDHLLIDVESTLTATRGDVTLNGDRQHAGLQFRAAAEVNENQKETRYLRPAGWAELPASKEYNGADFVGLPWNALQYPLGDRKYTVAYLSHPANPKKAEFSERLYGRFGEFFSYTLKQGEPLTVRYRFWITADGDATRDTIEARHADFASPIVAELVK
ncbi:MAG: DUF6807 family protein, partial [Planctomycetia bacterium]